MFCSIRIHFIKDLLKKINEKNDILIIMTNMFKWQYFFNQLIDKLNLGNEIIIDVFKTKYPRLCRSSIIEPMFIESIRLG